MKIKDKEFKIDIIIEIISYILMGVFAYMIHSWILGLLLVLSLLIQTCEFIVEHKLEKKIENSDEK